MTAVHTFPLELNDCEKDVLVVAGMVSQPFSPIATQHTPVYARCLATFLHNIYRVAVILDGESGRRAK
jgi:hypothetical protein